jgi:general secretion pathway protein B
MSFILDALKKSESDRQRQSGPSLFEVKVAPPRRTLPVWAVVVAALLLINVVVISWMLLRHPATQQPASPQDTAPARSAAQPGAPASAPAEATASTVPPLATPPVQQGARPPDGTQPPAGAAQAAAPPGAAPLTAAPLSAAPLTTAPPATPRGTALPTGSAEQSPGQATAAGAGGPGGDPSDTAPAVEPPANAQSGSGDLPLYQQIVGSAGLPDLHLDLHVFAARPQDRFVMVNMHRLGEGDSLPNGVQVQAIRPDGVVLSYHGTRFLLPRN